MKTKRQMRKVTKVALVLGLAAGLTVAGLAVAASLENTVIVNSGLGKAAAPLTAAPTVASNPVGALAVRACAPGKAVVQERAVRGEGNGNLCLPVGRDLTGSTHVDPFYSSISSQVIGYFRDRVGDPGSTASTVVCWNEQDWLANGGEGLLGYVWPDSGVVNLSPDVCSRLDALTYDKQRKANYKTAEAVDTLAHESIHVAGIHNEARTECYAIQLTQFTGVQLGTSGDFGYGLGVTLLDQYDSWKGTEYYTPQCYDGSKLDLYPETTVFP